MKPNSWEVRYELAKAYYEEYGNLNIPSKYRAEGIWLAKWVNEQKQVYAGKRKGKTLREDQVRRLEAIGMEWKKFMVCCEKAERSRGKCQNPVPGIDFFENHNKDMKQDYLSDILAAGALEYSRV